MIKIEEALRSLAENQVDFVVIGGIALNAYSSAYVTYDLDFCYSRKKENLFRIVKALEKYNPRPRDLPRELPFIFDETTLLNGTNFTFDTSIGSIDLLGEVAGIGHYPDVEKEHVIMNLFDHDIKILSINGLIKSKRAAGRPKDLIVLPELEALKELLESQDD